MSGSAVRIRWSGLAVGGLVFAIAVSVGQPAGWTEEAWSVAGIGLIMAIWWMTEAIPIPITALLPLILFPIMGVSPIELTAAPYAHPLIFLFLGGFLLAEAVQQSGLHRRIALFILKKTAGSVHGVVWGFMVSTAFISMWVSNTATTIMMLPIGISVLSMSLDGMDSEDPKSDLSTYLLLAIAYSASIGGLATLIGTAPNTFMAAFMADTYGVEIGFGEWMIVGLPVTAVGLPIVFFVLKKLFGQNGSGRAGGGKALFEKQFEMLGSWSRREVRVALIFFIVATSWVIRPLLETFIPGISDTGIALTGALFLFLIPSGKSGGERLLSWQQARNVPWGVLLLFGGGLALARSVTRTGLANQIGQALATVDPGYFLVVVALFVLIILLLTEMTSNTAAAAAFLPVVGAAAISIGVDPIVLVVPTTIAASCAFMLPVATPPNAIVFGSGRFPLSAMIKAGVWLNLIFAVLISLMALVLPFILD